MSVITALLSFDSGTLELNFMQICMRLLCAMVVGLVIGTEREYTHRPAGMRTHILVALGACAVMITGQLIFAQYSVYGAMPDPSRLSAQVITGVGFLGAGTIMREGTNVKGLTTAASLWAVACLGIAAGGGYYAVALAGMVFILITLTFFEALQNLLVGKESTLNHYQVKTQDVASCLKLIKYQARKQHASVRNMLAEQFSDSVYRITFTIDFDGVRRKKRRMAFLEGLASDPVVASVQLCTDEEAAAIL